MVPGQRAVFQAIRLMLIIAATAPFACGHAAEVSYQIKASYIYNFLQFVTFPQADVASRGIHVCILGEDRFGSALNELQGASTPQGSIHVELLGRYTPTLDLSRCHLIYVVETERKFADQILAKTRDAERLTIGEFEPFLRLGGLIQLVETNDVIRFRINKALANKSGLIIDAQLIQLSIN